MTAGTALEGYSVLVVDDDDDVRTMIATVLRAHGADVLLAAHTTQACELASTRAPDVVLVDRHLGDTPATGGDLLDILGKSLPDLLARTAIVTGDLRGSVGSELRGRPVLVKPFRPAELVAFVTNLLDSPTGTS